MFKFRCVNRTVNLGIGRVLVTSGLLLSDDSSVLLVENLLVISSFTLLSNQSP